jgi:methylated-DNA-[protein]-cysteine S-methyltransferase
MMDYCVYQSPVGQLTLVSSALGLAGVYFEQHRHFKQPENWRRQNQLALFQEVKHQLDAYFAGTRQHFDLPLDVSGGTVFQQAVWQTLLTVPYGQTASYAQIAQQIGRPAAVRAVGAANGRNPLSIVVPCHRIIASNGALTGYAGGLSNKTYLLRHEAAIASTDATSEQGLIAA